MKFDWKKLANKIDDMSLRQRALIFAMAALILVTLINTAFLDPLLTGQKLLSQQIIQQQNQIRGIQAQIQAMVEARSTDPDAVNRAKLESLGRQLAQLEAFLQGKQQHLIPPDKMAGLVEDMLNRNARLQLMSLETLPVSTITGKQEQTDRQIFMHGVEITVAGRYLDLLDYVAQLEKLPSQMFWGKAALNVEEYPISRLTLTLYTLSLDRAWLVV
ncbi:MAG TPA: MSHA biogenesis protein MshJ [Burkholderiales bacterium]|nr:MSHA biogenesis protein MshJ [Burkholderiales bacterium]